LTRCQLTPAVNTNTNRNEDKDSSLHDVYLSLVWL
jgi:hypothetical protein